MWCLVRQVVFPIWILRAVRSAVGERLVGERRGFSTSDPHYREMRRLLGLLVLHLPRATPERTSVDAHGRQATADVSKETLDQAVVYARSNNFAGARKLFAKLIEAEPPVPEAHRNYAVFLYQQGEKALAKAVLEKGCTHDPGLWVLLLDLADAAGAPAVISRALQQPGVPARTLCSSRREVATHVLLELADHARAVAQARTAPPPQCCCPIGRTSLTGCERS